MSAQVRCRCQSCTIRGLTGPAVVITVGLLLLMHQLRGGYFDFKYTFPVILVVIGFLHLASSFASREGHIEPPPPPGPPAGTPQVPVAPGGQ